jgi:ADP-ribose pyrophosphatase
VTKAPHRDLSETRIDGEVVFDGRLLHVRRDRVHLPSGGEGLREYVVHPGAAAIVALGEDGRVVLEHQYRFAAGNHFYELPAGKLDRDEAPLAAARRELLEETGYRAERWDHLGRLHPCHAYSSEVIDVYLARELRRGRARLDADEFLDVLHLPAAEALAWARDGRITDAKTIAGLFWLDDFLRRESHGPCN